MRWADMDLLGHINNVVYVDYLQEARVDMLRTHGPAAARTGQLAEGTVVVRHEVTYAAPLHFGYRPVSIECWVTQVRAASFTVAYEVFHEDPDGLRQVYLRAKTVLTPYVFTTEQPRRITDEERGMLALFLEPEDVVRPAPFPRERPDKTLHYPVHVRFSDVDVYGHVNNVKYFEYFQEARISGIARMWEGLDQAPSSSRRPTSTTACRSSSARSRTTPGPGWPGSASAQPRSSPSSATATPRSPAPG